MRIRPLHSWAVWDAIFPRNCDHCGEDLAETDLLFCQKCWAETRITDNRDMPKFRHVDHAVSAYVFTADNMIRKAVHALKYDAQERLSDIIARRMLLRLPTRFLEPQVIWTPVPQHWMRRMERSFNQSSHLANSLSELCRRELPANLLRKKRNTRTQTMRTLTERRENVKGAFSVIEHTKLPESVLIIDDVITTGATVDECAKTLKEGGVNWVGAYSFALAK